MFDNIYILIPVYNEEKKIKKVILELKKIFQNIIVVKLQKRRHLYYIIFQIKIRPKSCKNYSKLPVCSKKRAMVRRMSTQICAKVPLIIPIAVKMDYL